MCATGYLFLATAPEHLEAQSQVAELQRRCGARVELLDQAQVAARLPGLNLGGSFGPDDGLADPGAAVRTRDSLVASDAVLVAAGPWSPPLLSAAGFELPVTPRHRQVYRSTRVEDLPADCPFVVDLGTGVYFHPDGGGRVFGGGDREGAPGLDESFRPEDAPRIIELLARRLPQALEARLTGGWAGVRDMTPDDHGVVGRLPGSEALLVASGFSGHGFMHAPALGEEIARLIAGEAPAADISALSPARFSSRLSGESYVF